MSKNKYTRFSPPPIRPSVFIDPNHIHDYLASPEYQQQEQEWDEWLQAQGLDDMRRQYIHTQVKQDFIKKARQALRNTN